MRLKIDRFTTGKKSKMFQTNQGIFVGNIEDSYDNFAINVVGDNRFCLKDGKTGSVLKNMYPIDELQKKSFVETSKPTETNTFLDVYSPSASLVKITQFNNVVQGLTNLTNLGISYQTYNPTTSAKEYIQHKPVLAIYPPSGEIEAVSGNLEPRFLLSGVYFNFMEEMPCEFDFYDYTTGVMYSNSMNMKNSYDYKWDISGYVDTDNLSGTLDNTRYYTDLNSDGDRLIYNVYKLSRDYTSTDYTSGVSVSGTFDMDIDNIIDYNTFDDWDSSLSAPSAFPDVTVTPNISSGFITQDDDTNCWIYAVSGGTVTMSKSDVFTTSGLYGIDCYVTDYNGGNVELQYTTTTFANVSSNGLHRFVVDIPTTGNKQLKFTTNGTDLSLKYIDVYKIPEQVMTYDFAERIDGLFRYSNVAKHKSNLFSIRIKNSRMNEEADRYSYTEKDDVQKTINNIVRQIIEKITPIHTQLFSVDWTGL